MSTAPDEFDSVNPYDAARAESDLAFIAKKRREIEWWQHNIAAAEEKIAKAEERLKAFAIAYRQTVGGSQISLANGFVSVTKQRERTEIYDREAWSKWVDEIDWPEDYYDDNLNESRVKGALKEMDDGQFTFKHDGLISRRLIAGRTARGDEVFVEVVPGVRRVKPGPLDFNVKINAGRGEGRLDPFEKRHVARTINEESTDADESE